MLGIALWFKKIRDRILYAFPWLKKRKSSLKNAGIHASEEKEGHRYRYKVCASLYVEVDGEKHKDTNKKMLTEKIYENVSNEEAIRDAFNRMKEYYDSIGKQTNLHENELMVTFEDGMIYHFCEPELILLKDNDAKKSLRDLNQQAKKLVEKMMK